MKNMINPTLKAILAEREDISDYLFHFTKGRHAFDILLKILTDGELKDIKRNGYICFTEAPLTALYNMFQIFDRYPEPMYAPYGVGIKKDVLYDLGCRPVIYGTNEDFETFPKHLYWRCVEYIPNCIDYSWLREWRLKMKELKIPIDNSIVITQTDKEQLELMQCTDEFDFDGDIDDGEFHGYATCGFERKYKGVSMEDIKEVCNLSKSDLYKLLIKQNIGDVENRNLGYF